MRRHAYVLAKTKKIALRDSGIHTNKNEKVVCVLSRQGPDKRMRSVWRLSIKLKPQIKRKLLAELNSRFRMSFVDMPADDIVDILEREFSIRQKKAWLKRHEVKE